jgi:hypothetical protein
MSVINLVTPLVATANIAANVGAQSAYVPIAATLPFAYAPVGNPTGISMSVRGLGSPFTIWAQQAILLAQISGIGDDFLDGRYVAIVSDGAGNIIFEYYDTGTGPQDSVNAVPFPASGIANFYLSAEISGPTSLDWSFGIEGGAGYDGTFTVSPWPTEGLRYVRGVNYELTVSAVRDARLALRESGVTPPTAQADFAITDPHWALNPGPSPDPDLNGQWRSMVVGLYVPWEPLP